MSYSKAENKRVAETRATRVLLHTKLVTKVFLIDVNYSSLIPKEPRCHTVAVQLIHKNKINRRIITYN